MTSDNLVRNEPFPSWPHFCDETIKKSAEILKSGKVNYWTGEEGKLFEKEFSEMFGSKYGVAVANGTLALELALHSCGVKAGDEVIVTSRTFIASISAIVMRGAIPVLADIDPSSQNVTASAIEEVLSEKTKALIVVHLAGWPCDMDPIMDLANRKGLKVIEDCAQAHGAKYKGRFVGSIGHVGAFSFCQDKIMSTGGEGGMLITNDHSIWEKAWSYKDHGKCYSTVFEKSHPPGYRWLHESFGTNWRMPEIQAAIGRIQLRSLSKWVERRRALSFRLIEGIRDVAAIELPLTDENYYHAYYKFYLLVQTEKLNSNWSRDRIMQEISREGIPCFNTYAGEVSKEKAFENEGYTPRVALKHANEVGKRCLQFLVHPTLTEKEIDDTVHAIRKVFTKAVKSV